MTGKSLNTGPISIFVWAIVLMLSAVSSMAAGETAAERRANARAQKRQGMPTSASEATSGTTKYLEGIFKNLNDNQQPDSKTITDAATHLKGCRSFLAKFKRNKEQVADYYMLTAWVNYFSDDAENALRAAQKAYTTDRENPDAKATVATITLLTDNKPAKPSKKTVEIEKSGQLDLDTKSLKDDLLGRKITSFQSRCLNSTTFEYKNAQENLCIMFWQLKEASSTESNGISTTDPNDGTRKPKPKPKSVNLNEFESEFGPGSGSEFGPGPGTTSRSYKPAKKTSFDEEMSAFGKFYLQSYGNPEIKFVAVNTNKTVDTQTIIAKLMENNWPWAQLMANTPDKPISQFADISSDKPFLAIVDKTGTVKYAGSASGFLPKMMLAKITGMSFSSQQQDSEVIKEVNPQPKPATRLAPRTTIRTKRPRELDEGEKFQAGKELGAVRDIFLSRKSQRLITPKRGIEMCRSIIKKYPDTEYADQARTLLRENVDPRYRKRYNLTDEELGL